MAACMLYYCTGNFVCVRMLLWVYALCICACACFQRGTCQGSWEGSKGEVVNQDRQEQHPGVPRMTVLLGAVGPSAQIPLWSEHQLRTVLLRSSARGKKDNLLFPGLTSHYKTRAQERIHVQLGFSTAGTKVHSDVFQRRGSCFYFLWIASS